MVFEVPFNPNHSIGESYTVNGGGPNPAAIPPSSLNMYKDLTKQGQ